ncbi:MAG TPA: NADH-quinone oxidoreductase subunit N, partial [Spirochaetia bacterium]
MSSVDFVTLLPLVVIAAGSIVVLLVAAFTRNLTASFLVTAVVLVASLVLTGLSWSGIPSSVGGLLSFDGFVLFGFFLITGATLFVAVSSWAYLRGRNDEAGDYYFLLLLSALGGLVLAASTAFATFFLGLELLSVALYALIGWRRDREVGTEAAIKYLVLAGASSAFLLFGMALIYAETGSMDLARLAAGGQGILVPVGIGMMIVGIGFKLAVVPFHLWTPDVYDGAPAPVTGYIATVSKGAMVVVLARIFAPALIGTGGMSGLASGAVSTAFPWVIALIAGLSMFAGNILALRESNVKRILAYSSIAHLGYILVAFLAGGADALRAVAFYLVAYFATTLGAFAVISELSGKEKDADTLPDYEGLAARRPWMAGIFTAMLLSLAGLPLTAGFVGKFLILQAGAGAQLWILAVILAVNGTISIFYYLKIVSSMFRGLTEAHGAEGTTGGARGAADGAGGAAAARPSGEAGAAASATATGRAARTPLVAACALALLTLAVVALGVYPSP